MKAQYEKLLKDAKAALDEAGTKIGEGKIDEAKALQEKAKGLREQALVVKAQLDALSALESDEKDAKIAELEAAGKKPVRPMVVDDGDTPKDDDTKAFAPVYVTRYGELKPAVEQVLKDLYGVGYYAKRETQRNAFVKYLRWGLQSGRLTAEEAGLIQPHGKNIILTAEAIEHDIKSGLWASDIKAQLEESSFDIGGALVPDDYRMEIIKRLMGLVQVRPKARVVTTTRDAIEWPRLEGWNAQYTSAVRVTWVDETPASATVAATNPTYGLVRIPVHTVMARTDLSRNLLEDAAVNLLDILADLFAEAMAIDEDTQFLTGTGGGRPYGVLGDRSGAEQTIVTGVTDVNSGNATAITADGLMDLVYSLPAQYRGRASLIASRTTHRDIRKLKDGQGNYLWQTNYAAGQPPTILGYPIAEDEGMPAIAANNYPVLFGDWKGYVIVDRVGMTVERITDSTLMGQNTVAVFARRRLGGQLVAPWAFAGLQIAAS